MAAEEEPEKPGGDESGAAWPDFGGLGCREAPTVAWWFGASPLFCPTGEEGQEAGQSLIDGLYPSIKRLMEGPSDQ